MDILIASIPVVVILFVLLIKRQPAHLAAGIGWIVAVPVVMFFFNTDWTVVWRSSLSGLLASMPVSLIVASSMFQMSVMEETGAVARFVSLMKAVGRTDRVIQIIIINVGIGALLNSLGALPMSMLPAVMLGIGYSSSAAILLPCIGYESLNSFAMLSVPLVVLSRFTGADIDVIGRYFVYYVPPLTVGVCLSALFIWNGWVGVRKGLLPSLLAGAVATGAVFLMNYLGLTILAGVAAGLAVVGGMCILLYVRREPVYDRHALGERDALVREYISLPRAIAPWMLLLVVVTLINLKVLPFYEAVYRDWAFPVEIIPGQPENTRPFWQAYFWIVAVTVVCLPLYKIDGEQWRSIWQKWKRRAPAPTFAAAAFFAIAFLYNNSGTSVHGGVWMVDPERNVVRIVAAGAAMAFGEMYALAAPFLGLLGGFIGGTETSSIAMLTKLHVRAGVGGHIGLGLLLAIAGAIGGGLASAISPAKISNAAASVDKPGYESRLIKSGLVITIILTAITAAVTYLLMVL